MKEFLSDGKSIMEYNDEGDAAMPPPPLKHFMPVDHEWIIEYDLEGFDDIAHVLAFGRKFDGSLLVMPLGMAYNIDHLESFAEAILHYAKRWRERDQQ